MGAVFGRDNLRDNRAARWVAVLADNQVAAACSRSVVLNNLSCPIVWVWCPVVITCGEALPAIVRHIKRSLQ